MDNKEPERPRSAMEAEKRFVRQGMVRWFNPKQLMGTGVKTLFSTLLGAFADKREMMPAMELSRDREEDCKPSEKSSCFYEQQFVEKGADVDSAFWLDYTADLGDGFNPTYTVATQLAAETLSLEGLDEPLPRGRLLVMGGDQVYPTASREEYLNRMKGPYNAAMQNADKDRHPYLYAIPGNHDWYDGLTSFMRLFCQQGWIGGWKTEQRRSYFAIKLPHNCWLWGLDIQLDADLDEPQKQYFLKVLEKGGMDDETRIILCTAEPSWVFANKLGEGQQPEQHKIMRSLEYVHKLIRGDVEQEVKRPRPKVAVTMAGDLHHYCRYESVDGAGQKITAGGGGAFLHCSHDLPESLSRESLNEVNDYRVKTIYPSPETSRSLVRRNLGFVLKNPVMSLLLGLVYAIYAGLLQSASATFSSHIYDKSLLDKMALGMEGTLKDFFYLHLLSPSSLVLAALIILSMVSLVEAPEDRQTKRWLVGISHGFWHILAIYLAMCAFAHGSTQLATQCGGAEPCFANGWVLIIFFFTTTLLGALLGGSLMGLYLWLSSACLNLNFNTAFGSLRIEDYKNFLRIKVEGDAISIYAIGIEKVPGSWSFDAGDADNPHRPWFKPDTPVRPHLIESVVIRR